MLSTWPHAARSRISLYRFHRGVHRGGQLTANKSALSTFACFTIGVALFSLGPVAAAAASRRSGRPGRVQTGLDVLEAQKFAPLRGKHVGVITNHTGVDSQGRGTIELLSHAPSVQVVALFSPEDGLAGRSDEKFASTKDPATGLP